MKKKTVSMNETMLRNYIRENIKKALSETNLQDFLPKQMSDSEYEDKFGDAQSRDGNRFAKKYFGVDYNDRRMSDNGLDGLACSDNKLRTLNGNDIWNYADAPETKRAEMDSDWNDLDKASQDLSDELADSEEWEYPIDCNNAANDKSKAYVDSYNGVGDKYGLNDWYKSKNESKKSPLDKIISEALKEILP